MCIALLGAGANIDARMKINGMTPLHVATAGGHLGTIVGLLKRNADITILDADNKLAIDMIADHVRDRILAAYCEASPRSFLAAYPLLKFKHRKHEWKNFLRFLVSKETTISLLAATTFGKLHPEFRAHYRKDFIAAMRTQPLEFLTSFSEAAFFSHIVDFASTTEKGLGNSKVFETEAAVHKAASDPAFSQRITEQAAAIERSKSLAAVATDEETKGAEPLSEEGDGPKETEEDLDDPYAIEPPHSAPLLSRAFDGISGDAAATAPLAKKPPACVSTSFGAAIAEFVPMEARDVMEWFARTSTDNAKLVAGLLNAIKLGDDCDEPKAAARAFVQIQIDLARKHREHLLAVVRVQRLRLANLWTGTWQGISREPQFKEYTELAHQASQRAKEVHGNNPAQVETRYDELAKQARAVQSRHRRFLRSLAALTGGKPVDLPLKPDVRILIESGTAPGNLQWTCGMICDYVRGGIVSPKVVQMKLLLDLFLACSSLEKPLAKDAELLGKNREAIVITAINDAMLSPTANGKWPITTINYYFADDVHRHICEVEFIHAAINNVRQEHGAETLYTQVRSAAELLRAVGLTVLPAGYAVATSAQLDVSPLDAELRGAGSLLTVRMDRAESLMEEQHSMLVASRTFVDARVQDLTTQVRAELGTCKVTFGAASEALQARATNVVEWATATQSALEARVEERNKQLVASNAVRQAALVKQVTSANTALNDEVTTALHETVDALEDSMRQMAEANQVGNESMVAKQAVLATSITEKLQTSLDTMEIRMAKVVTKGQENRDDMQKSHLELEVRVANAVGKLVKMQQTQITEQRSLIGAQQSEIDSHQLKLAQQEAEINKLQIQCSRIDQLEAASSRHQAQLKRLEPLLWFAPHLEALLSGASAEGAQAFAKSSSIGTGLPLKNTNADQLMQGQGPHFPMGPTRPRFPAPTEPANSPSANERTLPISPDSTSLKSSSPERMSDEMASPEPAARQVLETPGRAFAETLANVCKETPSPSIAPPKEGGSMLLSSMGKALGKHTYDALGAKGSPNRPDRTHLKHFSDDFSVV